MNQTKQQEPVKSPNSNTEPQLRVKTSLRSGQSVDACMRNLQYWQDDYYKWYEQAKYKSV